MLPRGPSPHCQHVATRKRVTSQRFEERSCTLQHVAHLTKTTRLTLPCAHVRQIVKTGMPRTKRSEAQQAALARGRATVEANKRSKKSGEVRRSLPRPVERRAVHRSTEANLRAWPRRQVRAESTTEWIERVAGQIRMDVEASGGSGTDSSLADVVPTLRSASSAFLQRWGRCVYQTCCDVSGARSSGVRVGVRCVRLVCLSCVLRAVRQAASTSSVPRGL